jgi:hypothetical protein
MRLGIAFSAARLQYTGQATDARHQASQSTSVPAHSKNIDGGGRIGDIDMEIDGAAPGHAVEGGVALDELLGSRLLERSQSGLPGLEFSRATTVRSTVGGGA